MHWQVIPYHEKVRDDWEELTSRCLQKHFQFSRNFVDYHGARFQDASLLLTRSQRPEALLIAEHEGGVVHSHRGLTFGGMTWLPTLSAVEVVEAWTAALQHYRDRSFAQLHVRPLLPIYQSWLGQEQFYALWRLGGQLVRRDLCQVIELAHPGRVAKGRKSCLSRARREGVKVVRGSPLAEFYPLLQAQLRDQFGVSPTHSQSELCSLMEAFPGEIEVWTARHEGGLIAGVLTFVTPYVVKLQYIAANSTGKQLGAVDAVLAEILANARARYLDLGTSHQTTGDRPLQSGLVRFKELWGARGHSLDTYRIDLR